MYCQRQHLGDGVPYLTTGMTMPQLSRLFLYYATRVWVGLCDASEDSGAQIRDVMKALAKYGTCFESTWEYDPAKFSTEPSQVAKDEAAKHTIVNYFRCGTLQGVRQSLAAGYPVVGGFSVPASMMSDETAQSGIVKYPGPNEELVGGHAILFMGHNDTSRMLTFENSWGEGWGDKGYGYLPYEYVTNGMADDFWTIRAEKM